MKANIRLTKKEIEVILYSVSNTIQDEFRSSNCDKNRLDIAHDLKNKFSNHKKEIEKNSKES